MKLNIKHVACVAAAYGAITLGLFGTVPSNAADTQRAGVTLSERDFRPVGDDAAADSGAAARCVCPPGQRCPLCAPSPKPPPPFPLPPVPVS